MCVLGFQFQPHHYQHNVVNFQHVFASLNEISALMQANRIQRNAQYASDLNKKLQSVSGNGFSANLNLKKQFSM